MATTPVRFSASCRPVETHPLLPLVSCIPSLPTRARQQFSRPRDSSSVHSQQAHPRCAARGVDAVLEMGREAMNTVWHRLRASRWRQQTAMQISGAPQVGLEPRAGPGLPNINSRNCYSGRFACELPGMTLSDWDTNRELTLIADLNSFCPPGGSRPISILTMPTAGLRPQCPPDISTRSAAYLCGEMDSRRPCALRPDIMPAEVVVD